MTKRETISGTHILFVCFCLVRIFFSRASVSFCIWKMSDEVGHKQTGNCSRFLTPFARSMHAQEFHKARVDQIASDRQRVSCYIRTEKSDSYLWPATRARLAVFVSCLCTCAVWGVGWKIFRNILYIDLQCRHLDRHASSSLPISLQVWCEFTCWTF